MVCVFTLQVKYSFYAENSNFHAIFPLIQNSFTLDVQLVSCESTEVNSFTIKNCAPWNWYDIEVFPICAWKISLCTDISPPSGKKIGRRVPSPDPVFLREGRRLCTGYRKVKQFQSLNKNRLDDSLLLEFVSFLLPARILIPTSETAMKQWHERNGMATNDT